MPDQQKYVNKLQGKRVLILGGSAGLGYGVAEACLENGSAVFISSSNERRVQKSVTKLQEAYPSKNDSIKGCACDLSGDDVEAKLVELLQKVGDVEHVVFTAGDSLATMPIEDVTLEKIKKAGQIRYFAPLLLAKHLPKSTQSYTMTSGGVGVRPNKQWSLIAGYCAALHGLTRNLALDLAPVRVNLISPGLVDTDLWRDLSQEVKSGMFKQTAEKLPTGRVGQIEDVAEGYLAFMRDDNCTGSIYTSDGGHLLI